MLSVEENSWLLNIKCAEFRNLRLQFIFSYEEKGPLGFTIHKHSITFFALPKLLLNNFLLESFYIAIAATIQGDPLQRMPLGNRGSYKR